MTWQVLRCCIRRLLTPVYRWDLEPERTLRLLRRYQDTGHLLGSHPSSLVFCNFEGYFEEPFEGNFKEIQLEEERVSTENGIMWLANDISRNIRANDVFDPYSMNTGIIRLEITIAQFEFKPISFQMLQEIDQYSVFVNEDPHLHLRQLL